MPAAPSFFVFGATAGGAPDSVHPSSDAPAGCHIEHFAAADQDPAELSKAFKRIGVDAPVERSETPQLRARITGPKGMLEVTS
jgi:hypothetical protein